MNQGWSTAAAVIGENAIKGKALLRIEDYD